MVKTVTVPDSVDSSTELQKLIDSTGNTAAKFIISPDHDIEINSRLRFFDNFELDGGNCLFRLKENVSTSIFGAGVPLMAPKNPLSAEGLCLHDFRFDGHRDNQNNVPDWRGHNGKGRPVKYGQGYHNVIMLGTFGCVGYEHAKNCEIYNVDYKNSLGDFLRVEGGTNIKAHDIKSSRCGHDVVHMVVKNGEIYNINGIADVNAIARLRSSINTSIHDCTITGSSTAYAPGIEIQNTAKNWDCYGLEVYNNTVKNTLGPGIQVASNINGRNEISIHNNTFGGCGIIPSLPGVGAIIFDGFNVDIQNNTIVNSHGYGIAACDYNVGSSYPYKAIVKRNIVTGTEKSKIVGTASGSGIANLFKNRYTFECEENDVYGNARDLYQVTNSNGMSVDPLFVGSGDYHLKDSSPCIFSDYQLGRYNGTSDPVDPIETEPVDDYTPVTKTVIDQNKYTTTYTSYGANHVQRKVILNAGDHAIRIDKVGFSIANIKKGILASGRVTAQVAGEKEEILAEWAVSKQEYQVRSKITSEMFDAGKDVTLRWHLKTGTKRYKALMTACNYTYTLV